MECIFISIKIKGVTDNIVYNNLGTISVVWVETWSGGTIIFSR